ncbi:MAG: TonB-dependent receptor [Bryobacterales bacterium]|nr:TonB-dependent receptor [Bryobacterales bacterium]
MLENMKRLALFVVMLLITALPMLSQTGTATIRGSVYDAARAAVPNATIIVTNQSTNAAQRATSSSVGFFLFSGLPPGKYQLTAELTGFKKWATEIELRTGDITVVDPMLEVGSVDVVVEVSGAAPIIATESSELGDVKDKLRIQQLPLNGRSVTTLFDLTPGVNGGGNARVNGLKVGSMDITLDGMSMVDRFGGGIARVQPGLDTIEEFRIETVGSGAQFSRPATVTLVTKSGTNQLHGSAFETFRNNAAGLVARQRQAGNTSPFLVRNEFGASAGGPVFIPKFYDGRNRTFWFVAYEGLRERAKRISNGNVVPTVAMWDGDFTGAVDNNGNLSVLYDPMTTGIDGRRTPFLGNIIPKNRQNPVFGVLRSVTHMPTNNVNPYIGGNMDEIYSDRTNTDNLTLKADQVINDRNSLSFRYTRSYRQSAVTGGVFGTPRADMTNGFGTSRGDYYVYNGTSRWTSTITPTFLSELMVAAHYAPKSSGTLADFTDWQSQLGFPNPFKANGWPSLYAGDFGWDGDNRKDENLGAFVIDENLTWIHSNHTVKFGGRFRPESNAVQELAQTMGDAEFGGAWTSQYDPVRDGSVEYTGDGFADLALGLPAYVGAQFNRGFFNFRQKEIGLYVTDAWKVNSRLTLDIGLRWDKWTAYKEKDNRLVNVDPRSIGTVFQVVTPGDIKLEDMKNVPSGVVSSWAARGLTWVTADEAGLPKNLVAGDSNNFGPRLGFAYKLTDKTVLRGGYGEYYWTMPLSQILQAARINPPLALHFSTDVSTLDGTGSFGIRTLPKPEYFVGKVTIDTNGVVPISSSARSMSTMDPFDWRDSKARSYHFTLEHEFMKNTAVRFSYIGSQGRDLEQKYSIGGREAEFNYVARTGMAPPSNRDELRENKNWSLNATNHTGYSNSHSFQAEVERRYTNGLSFQAFYVFSRSLGTTDAGGSTSGNGTINATNGLFTVPEADQILGGGANTTYEDRLRLGYQNSTNIPAHTVRYNWLYELPFGKGKAFGGNANRAVDALIGGWQVAGNAFWRGGYWMGVNSARYLFGDPTLSDDQRLTMTYAGRKRLLWFAGDFDPKLATDVDQNALQALIPVDRAQRILRPVGVNFSNQIPQVMKDGKVRNTSITDTVSWNSRAFYRGPGAWNADVSLFKNFNLTEQVGLRFTADFFNALNHPTDASPDTTTGLQDLSVQSNGARTIQFSLRLNW